MCGVLARKQLDSKPGVYQAVRTPECHEGREVKACTEERIRVAIGRLEDFRVPGKSSSGQQRGIEPGCRGPAAVRGLGHRTHVGHETASPRRGNAERVLQLIQVEVE